MAHLDHTTPVMLLFQKANVVVGFFGRRVTIIPRLSCCRNRTDGRLSTAAMTIHRCALSSAKPLHHMSLTETAAAIRAKNTNSEQVTQACLNSIREQQIVLNCYITVMGDSALREAKSRDLEFVDDSSDAESGVFGDLFGIPIAIKDNFCTRGVRTTAGSKMLSDFVPPYDATVVEKLRKSGAVLIGKCNLDEFAMGSFNKNTHFGDAVNPYCPDKCLSPGGSSGGSASAVAAHTCYAAIGSDTGGSIRLPASYCGVVGYKPTYGLVSRWGLVSYASSFDTPSVIARSVADVRSVIAVIAGTDERDSTSLPASVAEKVCRDLVDHVVVPNDRLWPLTGVRVGIPIEYNVAELSGHVRSVWDGMTEILMLLGAEVVQVSLPSTRMALPAYYVLTAAEAASNLARFDGVRYGHSSVSSHPVDLAADPQSIESGHTIDELSLHDMFSENRSEGFGDEVKRRILTGNFVLSSESYSSYVGKAQKVRRRVANDFEAVFSGPEGVDVLLTPTAPSGPLSFDEIETLQSEHSVVSLYLNDVMTIPCNMAGLPAISIPAPAQLKPTSCGDAPIGLQIIGKALDDSRLLRIAEIVAHQCNNPIRHHRPT